MNLNNFMPTQIEDATPVDEKSIDIQYGVAGSVQKNEKVMIHRPNIRYGMSKSVQLEAQGNILSGGPEEQSGESEFNVLYQVNESETYVPEIALSPMAIFPTGKKMRSVDPGLKIFLTTTLLGSSDHPIFQIHYNQVFQKSGEPSSLLGLSYLIEENTSVVFDGLVSEDHEGKESYLLELGAHHHLGKEYYFGLSVAQGLGSSNVQRDLALALEKQFN